MGHITNWCTGCSTAGGLAPVTTTVSGRVSLGASCSARMEAPQSCWGARSWRRCAVTRWQRSLAHEPVGVSHTRGVGDRRRSCSVSLASRGTGFVRSRRGVGSFVGARWRGGMPRARGEEPANTGCCSHGDQGIVIRRSLCAVAVLQNPVSFGGHIG